MGKRNSQRKYVAMLDGDDDDDNSSVSSSSTARSDLMSISATENFQFLKDSSLDEALDDLYEKRGATRERALAIIIDTFNINLQHQFVEKKFATLLNHCLISIKKGSSKEIALASHAIGLLALTVGSGDNAREILEESVTPISQALKARSDSMKTVALLECLAIITFVGGNGQEETELSMQIMWQLVHPKLGSNVAAGKPTAGVIKAVVSAWAFLLSTMDGRTLNPKYWEESMCYFSSLLDKDDRSIRIAAGEALALIFEIGSLEKFASEAKCPADGSVREGNKPWEGFSHIQGLKAKILNQMRDLSAEAGGKRSTKKDLNSQRSLFKDVLEFVEHGYFCKIPIKIGGDSLQTSTWCKLLQLKFLKDFLGGGFEKHMQDNEFLHDVFRFVPQRKHLQGSHNKISGTEKRMYRSPNSVLNKARTQFLNKQRMLSKDRNVGHFVRGTEEL